MDSCEVGGFAGIACRASKKCFWEVQVFGDTELGVIPESNRTILEKMSVDPNFATGCAQRDEIIRRIKAKLDNP